MIICLNTLTSGKIKLENYNYRAPQSGSCLIFDNNIEYSELPVVSGIKYTLKTDIMVHTQI
jgi:hypothetical protein